MRIGFMGKGGSGKTTVTAAFSRWASEQRGKEVLVFDGDVNSHLREALAIDGEIVPIGHYGEEIAEYVKGKRTDLGAAPLLSTTPPAQGSQFLMPTFEDPLLSKYALRKEDISLVTVGSFRESDVGANCYHTKLHSLCMVLNHLLDGPEDLVVGDCTAGTDSLSTALLLAYDMNIFVVEPTQKSVQVYLDYIATEPRSLEKTFVIANKVVDEADMDFLRNAIDDEKILAQIGMSRDLRQFEQGDQESFSRFLSIAGESFAPILKKLQETPRDWGAYLERLHEIHQKNCQWWYNDYYGLEIDKNIDKNFAYESAL